MKRILLFSFFIIVFNSLFAQVSVHDEPRHKTVLQNEYVRLIDVHLPPGDTTLYHIHAAPSVIVHISKSIIGAQVFGQTPSAAAEVLPAQTRFAAYDKNPITHRVYNAGKNVFHVMDIELIKKNPSPDSCTALQDGNVETTINEALVRVYKLDLKQQTSLNIPQSNCAHLLICISGEAVASAKKLTTGDYIFYNAQTAVNVTAQNNPSVCVLLELK